MHRFDSILLQKENNFTFDIISPCSSLLLFNIKRFSAFRTTEKKLNRVRTCIDGRCWMLVLQCKITGAKLQPTLSLTIRNIQGDFRFLSKLNDKQRLHEIVFKHIYLKLFIGFFAYFLLLISTAKHY